MEEEKGGRVPLTRAVGIFCWLNGEMEEKSLWAIAINLLLHSERLKKRPRREVVRSRYEDDMREVRWASAATKQGQSSGNVSTRKRTRGEERLRHAELLLSPRFWSTEALVLERYPRGGGRWTERRGGENREAADVGEGNRWQRLEVWAACLQEAGSGEQTGEGEQLGDEWGRTRRRIMDLELLLQICLIIFNSVLHIHFIVWSLPTLTT